MALLVTGVGAAPPNPAPSHPTGPIATTLASLAKIEIRAEEGSTVGPEGRVLLKRLKRLLRERAEETLNAPEFVGVDAATVRKAINESLRYDGVSASAAGSYGLGTAEAVDVVQPEGHPELRAVKTTVGITCGDDSSLYVYRLANGRWSLALRLQADDYEIIKEAHGSLRYAVSPPDLSGKWYIVAADISPWCSSNLQTLRLWVLRPGERVEQPKVLLRGRYGVRLDGGIPAVGARSDGFSVSFQGDLGLGCCGLLSRAHVLNYEVHGASLRRIPPIAASPEGFVDEWVALPWADASRWVDEPARVNALGWHGRMSQALEEGQIELSREFRCPHDPERWALDYYVDEPAALRLGSDAFVVSVVRRDGEFLLAGIGTAVPSGCVEIPFDQLRP